MLKEFIKTYIMPVDPALALNVTNAFIDLHLADKTDRPLLYNQCVILCMSADIQASDIVIGDNARHEKMIDAFKLLGDAIMRDDKCIKDEIRALVFEGILA